MNDEPAVVVALGGDMVVVISNDATTGPRRTTINTRHPETWPAWISRDDEGNYYDDGSAGQTLPPIVSTTDRASTGVLVGVLLLLLFSAAGTTRTETKSWG